MTNLSDGHGLLKALVAAGVVNERVYRVKIDTMVDAAVMLYAWRTITARESQILQNVLAECQRELPDNTASTDLISKRLADSGLIPEECKDVQLIASPGSSLALMTEQYVTEDLMRRIGKALLQASVGGRLKASATSSAVPAWAGFFGPRKLGV